MSNKTGIIFLLILLGGVALFFSWQYVYTPKTDERKQIEAENNDLRVERDKLEAENRHKEEYEAEIKENTEFFYKQLEAFPGDLNQEATVMFLKNIQKTKGNLSFELNTVEMDRPELVYTVQAPANDEFGNAQYDCYSASYPTAYIGNYEGLKAVIDDVMAYKYRMNISGFDVTYDPIKDEYQGSLNFYGYSVNGNGREGEDVDVDVKKGKPNPFLDGEGGASVTSVTHDEDNGASIIDSHDAKIEINNANGDASEGVIVTAGSSSLTSSANEVVELSIKLEEEDGKVTVTYSLGGESFTSELTGDELDVFVSASERVNADDQNGVKLSIDNSTDISVFVKVNGDDSSSPRFKLGSKTGTVKVY